MSSGQKHIGFLSKLGVMSFAALLFVSVPAGLAAGESQLEASGAEGAATMPGTAEKSDSASEKPPCRGLKPINNLDELLYQIYINLDSDCLYDMSASELEKIWDIKILSSERAEGYAKAELRGSSEFREKPYGSEKDAFFVEIDHSSAGPANIFEIKITTEYGKKYGSLFPDGRFPKYLPEPAAIVSNIMRSVDLFEDEEPWPPPAKEGRYDLSDYTYVWVSSEEPKPKHGILLNGYKGGPEHIWIF